MNKLKYNEVDVKEIVFNKKLNDNGNATVFVPDGDKHKKLLFTTPKLKCSFSDNSVHFSVTDDNKEFLNFLIDIDDSIEGAAVENKNTWFSDFSELTDEEIRERYKGSIKNSKNRGTLFPVSKSKNLKIYDKSKTTLAEDEILNDDLCIGLVELDCITMGKNTFKNSFKIHHLKVMKEIVREVEIKGSSFGDNEEDNNVEIED